MPKQYTPAQAAAQTRARAIRYHNRRINAHYAEFNSVPKAVHILKCGFCMAHTEGIAFNRNQDERASRTAGGWDKDRGIKNKPRATGKKAPKGQGKG